MEVSAERTPVRNREQTNSRNSHYKQTGTLRNYCAWLLRSKCTPLVHVLWSLKASLTACRCAYTRTSVILSVVHSAADSICQSLQIIWFLSREVTCHRCKPVIVLLSKQCHLWSHVRSWPLEVASQNVLHQKMMGWSAATASSDQHPHWV